MWLSWRRARTALKKKLLFLVDPSVLLLLLLMHGMMVKLGVHVELDGNTYVMVLFRYDCGEEAHASSSAVDG